MTVKRWNSKAVLLQVVSIMQYYNGRPASISVSSVNHKAVADSPVGWVLAGPLIL